MPNNVQEGISELVLRQFGNQGAGTSSGHMQLKYGAVNCSKLYGSHRIILIVSETFKNSILIFLVYLFVKRRDMLINRNLKYIEFAFSWHTNNQ